MQENANNLGSMYEMLGSVMKPLHDLFPLKSLWVSEHKVRYHVGDEVIVGGNEIYGKATIGKDYTNTTFKVCKITKLMGTLNDSRYEITFEDLKTGAETTIKL